MGIGTKLAFVGNQLNSVSDALRRSHQAGAGLEGTALAEAELALRNVKRLEKLIEELAVEVQVLVHEKREALGIAQEQREINRATRVMLGDGKSSS